MARRSITASVMAPRLLLYWVVATPSTDRLTRLSSLRSTTLSPGISGSSVSLAIDASLPWPGTARAASFGSEESSIGSEASASRSVRAVPPAPLPGRLKDQGKLDEPAAGDCRAIGGPPGVAALCTGGVWSSPGNGSHGSPPGVVPGRSATLSPPSALPAPGGAGGSGAGGVPLLPEPPADGAIRGSGASPSPVLAPACRDSTGPAAAPSCIR
jgi:hypothetical protein